MSSKNEVAARKDTLPAAVTDMFAGREDLGMENADIESFAIPFLAILQSNSPAASKSNGAYINGAEEGMLLDTVSNTVLDGTAGITIIPCSYRRAYVEWGIRENGGGYKGEHPTDTPLARQTERDEKNRDILPNGNQLVDTRYHYCLLMREGEMPKRVVIAMSSTGVKKSKKLMSDIADKTFTVDGVAKRLPSFGQMYELKTVAESNDKGSWWNWSSTYMGPVTDNAIVEAAIEFIGGINTGEVTEATDSLDNSADAAAEAPAY